MVEQYSYKVSVPGSNPGMPTSHLPYSINLVRKLSVTARYKVPVLGSNPSVPTKKFIKNSRNLEFFVLALINMLIERSILTPAQLLTVKRTTCLAGKAGVLLLPCVICGVCAPAETSELDFWVFLCYN